MKYIPVLLILTSILFSCGGGLDPADAEGEQNAVLNGKIYFKGGAAAWPPEDSVQALRVVAFKRKPPFNTDSLIYDIVNKNAYLTFESLPLFVDTSEFSFEINDAPVSLKYIAAALQYDTTFYDQLAVGVFTLSGDKNKPSEINIEKGKVYNINIEVDFKDLPPQPFK